MSNQGKIVSLLIVLSYLVFGCNTQKEIEWTQEDGYRWAELTPGFWGETGFSQHFSSETGITFRNDVREELKRENRHYLNGSGVTVTDLDGDGLLDIYFGAIDGPNKLYRNLGGFQFEDITEQAGLSHEGVNSTGVLFADLNGDDHMDLLVTSLSDQNTLYINNGEGQFSIKRDSGLGASRGAHTMALADVNMDGKPDLYIANYKIQTARDIFSAREMSMDNTVEMIDGELKVKPSFSEYFTIVETEEGTFQNEIGEPDELYLNRGGGEFERVDALEYFFDSEGNPIGLTPDWGLTSTFRDVNADGFPDLYVANDFWTPDRFWINRGDGTFRRIDPPSIQNMSFSSMGVDFSDINRDGFLDFFVTEMLSGNHSRRVRQSSEYLPEFEGRTLHNRNSLYLNRGDASGKLKDPSFSQIAYYSGLEASEWSWATTFSDIDLDGYEDLIIATGFNNDYQDMDTQIAMYEADMGNTRGGSDILRYPRLELRNKIFKNNRDLTFSDVSSEWGFEQQDISMGMALADLDNDGDQDLIFNRLDDKAAVYENRSLQPRIAVRLKGVSPNVQAVGAKIELKGGKVDQFKEVVAGGNYLSGSDQLVVFAAEEEQNDYVLTITWPDGSRTEMADISANRIYEIEQSSIKSILSQEQSDERDKNEPIFLDRSDKIDHTHHENSYDDFRFSPLLPLKLSRLGPGVAWMDVDRDNNEDLIIGSGKGGQSVFYLNEAEGNFKAAELGSFSLEAPGDQTSIVAWSEENGTRIVVGSANYEQGDPNAPSAYIYSVNEDVQVQQIPGILSTTGPIAAADYNGDGTVDLFIGGRHKPGQYPVNADSRFFQNVDGRFQLDRNNSLRFAGVGLVTDALFSDFTGDGQQDLLISTEWGTLKLFEYRNNGFSEITDQVGLDQFSGWWYGITVGDFTGNGLPDIVALNIGLNSSYQIDDGPPLRMYYDDFNWDRRLDILETYYSEEVGGYVPRRKLHDFESVPTILSSVNTHEAFSEASVEKIFNQSFNAVPFKEVNTLKHMLFINTGDGFKSRPLPQQAQFSNGFYAGVIDFDNDGNEDLFISQNFYGFPKSTPRQDAGRGLLLKGDGNGSFEPVPAHKSGILVNGEQRGAAIGDYNQDGKSDLVVSQNDGQTKLFENQVEKEGIRVRLVGSPSNLNAVGAAIRLEYPSGNQGPVRFIQSGGSYYSQNSFVQVLGFPDQEAPSAIEIRWPDGSVERVDMREGQKEIVIRKSS